MLEVLLSPNPLLLEPAAECDLNDDSLKKLSQDMLEVMYRYSGIGLAGPQVGVLKRIIVIDTEYDPDKLDETKNPVVLINPKFVKKSKEMVESDEGCLSCPGISAPVLRHESVTVEYFDLDGNKHSLDATDLLSKCLQHEMDHLEGKTLFQTALPQARLQLIKDYEAAIAKGAIPGETSLK